MARSLRAYQPAFPVISTAAWPGCTCQCYESFLADWFITRQRHHIAFIIPNPTPGPARAPTRLRSEAATSASAAHASVVTVTGHGDRCLASQLPRLATGRAAVTIGYSHRMFC